MDKKITRRLALGTLIGGLVAAPFITREWHRRRKITLPPDSFLAGLRTRFQPILDFPRTYDYARNGGRATWGISGSMPSNAEYRQLVERFRSLPHFDTIEKTHRRYWENFAQIDEIEFDCTHFYYHPNGQ